MQRYALSARILHWLMAIGFIVMWGCGYVMTSVVADDSPAQDFLFGFHISLGVTLLFLLLIRIFVRFRSNVPALHPDHSKFEKAAASLGHFALYALPLAIIGIGWAETDFGGWGVQWFGIPMPKLFPTMELLWGLNIEEVTAQWHKYLAYAMLALALVHIAAVVKHRLEGHDVLVRMMHK